MKKLLIATALAGLFAGSGALAQDRHDDHGHGGGPGNNAPAAHPAAPAPAQHGPATDHGRGHQNPANTMAGPNRPDSHPGPDRGRPDNNNFNRPAMAAPNRAPTAMRGPGNNNAHRDYSTYHRNFTAPRHFHASSYRRPSGWYAHRWTFGEILPALFWTHDYWLDDFNDYGLMSPPPGTVWVRDGDDALLIDRYTGEVIQVEYGVFY